jgi:two-component sensor histidine kinase
VRASVGLDGEERQFLGESVYAWEDYAVLLQERFRVGRCYFFPHQVFTDGEETEVVAGSNGYHLEKSWHPEDALLVPVEVRPGQIEGIISLGQPLDGRRPDSEMVQALEVFASQTAAAIENARLYEQVQQDLVERMQAAEQLRRLNEQLEDRVKERTAELARTNQTLQAEIVERQRVEARITASLHEKELLLQEIHHRVKNNLQVISSLLNLQAGYIDDLALREILRESQNRVRSMALVHEKLYRSDDLAHVDLAEYIRNLATFLFRSYTAAAGRVSLDIQADDVFLSIDAAVPCGLILNELISNALKHAFPGDRKGQIRVELQAGENRQISLIVGDTGIGFPKDFDFENAASLGMQLVQTLVMQLNGTLEIDGTAGSEFRITFGAP